MNNKEMTLELLKILQQIKSAGYMYSTEKFLEDYNLILDALNHRDLKSTPFMADKAFADALMESKNND